MQDAHINETHNASSGAVANTANGTSSAYDPSYFQEPVGFKVFQITLWSTVAFLGVLGNMLVCLVILGRLRKTAMNYYLLSLAIADLGVLIFIYPVSVAKYVSPDRWLLGEIACLYMIPTAEIFFGASIWSITIIAIERYRNIAGARRYRFGQRSHFRTRLMIIGVWLASFLVSSVPIYPLMTCDTRCSPSWPTTSGKEVMYYTYTSVLIAVGYILPLTVIAFTYVKIKERVRDSIAFRDSMALEDNFDFTKMSHSNHTAREKRVLRKSNKTARILTPLAILFAVTMFPLNALRVYLFIEPDFAHNKYFNLIFGQIGLFVLINSSANPLVYYITSREFKEAFKAVLASLQKRKNLLNQFRTASSWRSSRSGENEEMSAKPRNKQPHKMTIQTEPQIINVMGESAR